MGAELCRMRSWRLAFSRQCPPTAEINSLCSDSQLILGDLSRQRGKNQPAKYQHPAPHNHSHQNPGTPVSTTDKDKHICIPSEVVNLPGDAAFSQSGEPPLDFSFQF